MDLATHQRKLLGLIRSTYRVCADDDPYILRVAESRDLAEARRNIFLWRVYVLKRTCALTFSLLKRRNLLEDAVGAFIAQNNISPFRETQAPAFLEGLSTHEDSLVASVARFELALANVRQGDSRTYVVPWGVEPRGVLYSLARDLPLDETTSRGTYQIVVSGALPYQFEIQSVEEAAA